MVSKSKITVAFVALFVLLPVALMPFRSTLVELMPEPTLWQSITMELGAVLLFIVGVRWGELRSRVQEVEAGGVYDG